MSEFVDNPRKVVRLKGSNVRNIGMNTDGTLSALPEALPSEDGSDNTKGTMPNPADSGNKE